METRPGSGVYVATGAPARCRKATRRAVQGRLRHVLDEALAAGLQPEDIEEMVSRTLHAAAGEVAER